MTRVLIVDDERNIHKAYCADIQAAADRYELVDTIVSAADAIMVCTAKHIRRNERWLKMQFKKGYGWKACYDEETGRYFGEYGGIQEYNLYELTKEQYDALDKKRKESSDCIKRTFTRTLFWH